MLINSPFAEYASARVSTSSVSRADNCLYSQSRVPPPPPPRWIIAFARRISDSCSPQRLHRRAGAPNPPPPRYNPRCEESWGYQIASRAKSHFILPPSLIQSLRSEEASRSQIWLINTGRRSAEKIMQGGKKNSLAILFASLRTCNARITTLEPQQFTRRSSPDAARSRVRT